MYVCMCICVYVYMCICIYVYMYICIYVDMYICIYVYMYTCIYAYMYNSQSLEHKACLSWDAQQNCTNNLKKEKRKRQKLTHRAWSTRRVCHETHNKTVQTIWKKKKEKRKKRTHRAWSTRRVWRRTRTPRKIRRRCRARICQKRPISVKRDPYLSKETHICQKRPSSAERDPYLSKETHICVL